MSKRHWLLKSAPLETKRTPRDPDTPKTAPVRIILQNGIPKDPSTPPPTRCKLCGWTVVEKAKDGCTPTSCSYRPHQFTPEWYRLQDIRNSLKSLKSKSVESHVTTPLASVEPPIVGEIHNAAAITTPVNNGKRASTASSNPQGRAATTNL